jgi:hypothetical protein
VPMKMKTPSALAMGGLLVSGICLGDRCLGRARRSTVPARWSP